MPAPRAYFDTSALVKRYVREPGAVRVRSLLKRYRVLSSAIAPAETLSALTRRRAAGDLTELDFTAILSRLRNDRSYWDLLEVSPLVLHRAEEVIMGTALRTLDALHVASALTFQAATGTRLPFVTADAQQRDAAVPLGLSITWVG